MFIAKILQVLNFVGCMSFVLLRFVFAFVCACLGIILCSRLVVCVFCCVPNFFLLTYQCQYGDAAFCHIFAGAQFLPVA